MQLLHWLPRFLLRHKTIDFLCKIGLQNRVSEIEFNNGARTIIDLSDPEPRNVFIKREFEPHFFDIANALMPQDGIFFDLGANVGFCSFGLVSSRPKANYHLFEANAKLITLLEKSAGLHPETDFQINYNCVTDQPGETRFCLEDEQSGQSHVATEEEGGEAVPNLLLDEYVEKHAIERIDFAKMDLEGHELNALRGWRHSLEAGLVKALYIEVMPENQKRYGLPTNAALAYLEECGYDLFFCKGQDLGKFGKKSKRFDGLGDSLTIASFLAREYPSNYSTDILALNSM
jgi:FkbM family methyltransferase